MSQDLLRIAQWWVSHGIAVIPLGYRDKRPAMDALMLTDCVENNRVEWARFQDRLPTADELYCWFAGPRRNLGIVTGWEGLVVIDFDSIAAYDLWRCWAKNRGVPETYQVATRRGVHIYVKVEEDTRPYMVRGLGVDVKAGGGYVLGVPSIHPSGHKYRAKVSAPIVEVQKLIEIFPIEGNRSVTSAPPVTRRYSDPWEAAAHAVVTPPDGAMEAIKANVRIEDVLGVEGCNGRPWKTLCPLHADVVPSLVVYPDGRWYCFGCQRHGDVIDLHAALHRISVKEAIAELAGNMWRGQRGGHGQA